MLKTDEGESGYIHVCGWNRWNHINDVGVVKHKNGSHKCHKCHGNTSMYVSIGDPYQLLVSRTVQHLFNPDFRYFKS